MEEVTKTGTNSRSQSWLVAVLESLPMPPSSMTSCLEPPLTDTLVWPARKFTFSGSVLHIDTLNGSLMYSEMWREKMSLTCWRCTSSSLSFSTSLTCEPPCCTFVRITSRDCVADQCSLVWRPSITLVVLTCLPSSSLSRRSTVTSVKLVSSPVVLVPWPGVSQMELRLSTGKFRNKVVVWISLLEPKP